MNIAILGYGSEGTSTYRFLTSKKGISPADITILDKNESITPPQGANISLGEGYLTRISSFDEIWRSPGFTNHKLEEKLGTEIFQSILPKLISQTSYFFQHYSGTTVAVTGTKGKSTTVSFLQTLLSLGKKSVKLVGNIGTPVLDAVDFTDEPDIVIYELSSYMLEDLGDRKHPEKESSFDYGILTSLSEAHAGSHGGLDSYISAKMKIITQSKMSMVSNQAYASEYLPRETHTHITKQLAAGTSHLYGTEGSAYTEKGKFFSEGDMVCDDHAFTPLGEHMRRNVSVGLLLVDLNNLTFTDFQKALALYEPLPHRLQFIGEYQKIKRYNDSFATTCHSVEACISTLGASLETLFVGGYDNLANITSLVKTIHQSSLQNIIIFPTTGERIKTELLKAEDKTYNILETDDIQKAVQRAYKNTTAGKSAALSCGFPSFTMRNNYVHRGENFTELVKEFGNT